MALNQVEVMRDFGFSEFPVIGRAAGTRGPSLEMVEEEIRA
jgi:hypothetical protein